MKTIYLAGPIAGLSYQQARHGWRQDFAALWLQHPTGPNRHTLLLSPMRSKSFLQGVQKIGAAPGAYTAPFGRDEGIVTRDRNDVMNCFAMVANFLGATEVSRGTMVEFGWADAYRKPIITIIEPEPGLPEGLSFGPAHPNPHWYCMVRALSGYIVHSIEDAVDIAASLTGGGL